MKRFSCVLICLILASTAAALSITNGDFEAYGVREDVPGWFDYTVGTGGAAGQTYLRLLNSPTGTQYMGFDTDDCWAYQSLGFNTAGQPAVRIQYQVGRPSNLTEPRNLVLRISIYESDGTFVGSDGADSADIDGAQGVTLIDSVTVSYPAVNPGQAITDSVTLNYIGAATGELFLRFANEGDDDDSTEDAMVIDNVQIAPLPSVVNSFPKNGAQFVATERTSAENDLVFTVADGTVTKVDVLFAPDPNLTEAHTIVNKKPVSTGQYRITLETEYPQNLAWSTNYYWRVLAYEPNGLNLSLKYASPIWSFKTIQQGPYLGNVTPARLVARAGKDAVFGLTTAIKADTYQWYKQGVGALSNGTKYQGVNTNTLTILNTEAADAGYYYCIGTQTSTGLTAQSLSNGRLMVGELKSYYPFETTYTVGNSLFTPDVVSGKDMQLMGGAGLSDYDAIAGNHLLLENPAGATLEWAQIADTTVAHYEDITIACWVRPTTLVNTIDRDRWTRVWDFGKEATEAFFLTMLYRQNDPRQGGWDVARSEWNWYTPDENGDGQPERHNQELDVEAEIVPEKWYYMVVTVENGYGRIYLNGECGTENEAPQGLPLQSPINFTKTYNYIGKAVGATVPYLNARIDELKIYNYAMNKQEIAEEYNRVTGVESVCDLEIYDLYDWDFNRNCKVDLPDFAEIAARWMMDYRIFPE
ncbi:MAG TPA: hypothetical protein PK054_00635 [Anaerohalosphaeraceae bacterium]|nr:hypothetical protein [Anaerohalosphaeraceae bacterium]HPP55069.1 hypothetical protein [Anaerohalosphaeraceae bacterium]